MLGFFHNETGLFEDAPILARKINRLLCRWLLWHSPTLMPEKMRQSQERRTSSLGGTPDDVIRQAMTDEGMTHYSTMTNEELTAEIRKRMRADPGFSDHVLREMAYEQADQSYKPEFVRSYPVEAHQEAMGLLLARAAGFNFDPIARAAYAALEDANFHGEAGIIHKWLTHGRQ